MKMGSWFTLMFALLVASKVHAQQTRDLVRDGHGGLRVQVDVGQVRITGMGCTPAPCSTFERYALGLTVELHQRITTLSPDLHLEFDLEAIAGLSEMQDDFGRFNGQWLGSPWLGVSVAQRTATQTMRLSLGVAPPLRTAVRRFGSTDDPTGLWGRWNQWLGMPSMVPVGLLGMSEWRGAVVDVGIDAAAVLAPTFNAEPGIVVPALGLWAWVGMGVWVGGHVTPNLDLGARAQAVLRIANRFGMPGFPGMVDAAVQVSAEPFIRYRFPASESSDNSSPWFAELRVQLNLNEPFGPPLGANGLWAMNLQVGSSW
jgi:hypothetical protein